ncbi:MAG: BrxA family protein [Gammaproteobacteria bacterium]
MAERRFYTSQLQAGLGLIAETRQLLELFEPGLSAAELTERALDSGRFPLVTARRLRNIVAECFAPRYLRSPNTAAVLKRLAAGLNRAEFSQLLLIHTARANLVLADFIRYVYWPRYAAGRDALTLEDAREFVIAGMRAGRTQKPWSDTTIRRVASYLLGCCADYELLGGNGRGPRPIQPLRLHTKVAAYLAYDLHFQGLGDNQILTHEDWQLFGLTPDDVRDQLKRLSLQGLLILQSAADVVHVGWTCKTLDELSDVITR